MIEINLGFFAGLATVPSIAGMLHYRKHRSVPGAVFVAVTGAAFGLLLAFAINHSKTSSPNPNTAVIQQLAEDRVALARTEAKSLELVLSDEFLDAAYAAGSNELSHDAARSILLTDYLSLKEHKRLFEYMAQCFNHYSSAGSTYPLTRLSAVEWIEAYRSLGGKEFSEPCLAGYPFSV